MFTGDSPLGALTFQSLFQKAQSLVSKTRAVAAKIAGPQLPPESVPTLPAPITPAQAAAEPTGEGRSFPWLLAGAVAVPVLLFLRRRKGRR